MKHFFISLFIFFSGCFAVAGGFAVNLSSMVSQDATVTSAKYLDSNPKRNYLLIQNNGSASVIIKFGSAHSGSEGIVIAAGGNYEPIKPMRESLYIKSSTGTQAVVVLEGN